MRKLLAILTVIGIMTSGCLAVPDGLHVYVSPDGCTSTGVCPYGAPQGTRNYYYAPLREAVLALGQGAFQVAHEICHGHEHQVVLDATGREPTPDLREWADTPEGRAFVDATGWRRDGGIGPWGPTFYPAPTPWSYLSVQSPLEDAANTCAVWLLDPDSLQRRDTARYVWATTWLQ